MIHFDLHIEVSGPVYDGRADIALNSYVDDLHRTVAAEGERLVGLELIRVLRHPTGYYESRITHNRVSDSASRVHDSKVIYGPWLEGIGSRNFPATRFRGYATFRRMTQQLARRALPVATELLRRVYLPRMNGR